MSPGPHIPGTEPVGDQPFAPPNSALAPDQDPAILKQLNDRAVIWLVVGLVGFSFFLPMFVTGPLGWWQGASVCSEYVALGRPPSGVAQGAKFVGIISTLLAFVGTLALIAIGIAIFAAVEADGGF